MLYTDLMCLVVLSYRLHKEYKFILAANRDEYYARPTKHLHWWCENPYILAGKDLRAQGTWFGITKNGKFGIITNYRDPSRMKQSALSRGLILKSYLIDSISAKTYMEKLKNSCQFYNGFNLIIGDTNGLYYFSNITFQATKLTRGIYGLSNHLLNINWPKVEKAKRTLTENINATREQLRTTLFEMLSDKTTFPYNELPNTGIGKTLEKEFSSIFVKTDFYGTRSSVVMFVDYNNNVVLNEKNIDDNTDVQFVFKIQ